MSQHRSKRTLLWSVAALVVLLVCAAPRPAAAHGLGGLGEMVGGWSPEKLLILSPGLTLGGALPTTEKGPGGLVLGGEVSLLAFAENMVWGGGYVDGVYGWDRHAGRLSVGGVFGVWFGGVDAGYLVDFSRGGPHHGVSVRLFAAAGIVTVYARYGYLYGAPDFLEFGVLLKLPFSLMKKDRTGWKEHVRLFSNF
jgi:hypothetical protein